MADQTVTPQEFGYEQACDALRKTAQAMAILQVIWIAVEAGEDGCVTFKGQGVERWQISIDAAVECAHGARDVFIEKRVSAPDCLDWWTPVNLLEAMGAALWGIESGVAKGRLQPDQLQSMIDVAMGSLGRLYEALSIEADRLKPVAEVAA
jgi:hypothetical protein